MSRDAQEKLSEIRSEKNESPLISVVVPTYNRAQFIEEAIQSALSQDYEAFEVVVVDDGSTDSTAEILATIVDERLRYILKEHSGAPATRNRGIAEARGDLIVWLDSDDILFSGLLSRHASISQQFHDAGVYYGDLIAVDAQLRERQRLQFQDWYGRRDEMLAQSIHGCALPNPGTMVRKWCYEQFGGYAESFPRAHDYELWSRLVGDVEFKHIGGTFCKYRVHGTNLTGGAADLDTSYEARIALGMLERRPLRALFPQAGWEEKPDAEAEATAYLLAAKVLAGWKDAASARKYLEKSLSRAHLEGAEELLNRLSSRSAGNASSPKASAKDETGAAGTQPRSSASASPSSRAPQVFMIATPTLDGSVKIPTALAWIELTAAIQRQGDIVTFAFPRGSILSYSRNHCARQAVEQKVDYLLFWDADGTVIQPRDFIYLMRDRLEQHGAWAAAAPFRFKSPGPPAYPVGRDTGTFTNPDYIDIPFGKTFEVEYIGTGLMLIPRRVLERIERPWFHVEDDAETLKVIPEDYYFCRKVRAAGGKLLCVAEIATLHFGEQAYRFPPEDTE